MLELFMTPFCAYMLETILFKSFYYLFAIHG